MRPRTVLIIVFDGVQSLDVTGPLEVFSGANSHLAGHGSGPAYRIVVAGPGGTPVRTSSGLTLVPGTDLRVAPAAHTLVVPGGEGTRSENEELTAWLRRHAPTARRITSVCTGAFLLARAGLLAGRRVTTHWAYAEALQRQFPGVNVDPEPIYVRDGCVVTSAGVTAGIDLALALVEEDIGREAALDVARHLVVFLRRPGGQAQFSAQLSTQFAESDPLRDLQAFILDHPSANLSVQSLSRRVAMSPRNFARVFTRQVGTTPARFISSARVETARRLLEETSDDLESICAQSGLGTTESMRRAFLKLVGVSPSQYRERFNRHPSGARPRNTPAKREAS